MTEREREGEKKREREENCHSRLFFFLAIHSLQFILMERQRQMVELSDHVKHRLGRYRSSRSPEESSDSPSTEYEQGNDDSTCELPLLRFSHF